MVVCKRMTCRRTYSSHFRFNSDETKGKYNRERDREREREREREGEREREEGGYFGQFLPSMYHWPLNLFRD